jgi:nucleotide-binding universal stress UspA family protein
MSGTFILRGSKCLAANLNFFSIVAVDRRSLGRTPQADAGIRLAAMTGVMIDIRRILCPVDFSDFSRRALDHAVALARWYGASVTLLNVCSTVPVATYAPGTPMFPPATVTATDREAIVALMQEFAATEGASAVQLEYDVREGNAAEEILAKAHAMASDLLVLGTHGRSGFERLMLGSITEKVLRKAACPVLTVPRNTPDVVPAPPVVFRRVLCAVDFSRCSLHALNYALSLAQEADAALTLLHVIEVPPEVPAEAREGVLGTPRTLREYVAAAERDRRERLETLVPQDARSYCRIDTVMATGKAYREILRVAAERQSDLVVIGIHGRSAADLLFFGSTAQHVLREAACPVLTLRHD